MARLLAGLGGKLTLISAPAGFGKSTLAAEFARQAGRQAAWFSHDAGDNHPARWGAYLAEALRAAGLPLGEQAESLLRLEGQPLEALVATLINQAAAAGRPLLLVLDDYHVISSGVIHEAVALLLDRLPPNLHLVIATRTRPPLPLARLKVRGELTQITASDLRFSRDEAAAFLHEAMGLDLPADSISALAARTEGWVAGLQLAALSLQGTGDWAAATVEFGGHSPDLLEYLVDEVINHQPEEIQAFLLRTSILDRLTGPLCEAVTGMPEGQRTLQALEQANLFLSPLDPERRWFRYHPLFAEFLRARLTSEAGSPGVAALHLRAAHWCHDAGHLPEAVDHQLLAGGFEQAADWMEEAAPDWCRGTSGNLRRWVEQLPEPVIRQRPLLGIMSAWALVSSGDVQAEPLFVRATEYLEMASQALGPAEDAPREVRERLGMLAAVRTALAPWAALRQCPMCTMQYVAEAFQSSLQARELLPESSLFWRSVVMSSLGAVYLRAGSVAWATQAFGEAARLGTRSRNLPAAVSALHQHAQLLTALGELGRADDAYREALRLAAREGGEALPTLAPIYLGMGRLRYEWDDLDGAAASLSEALRRYEASGSSAAPEALLALARVEQARGDAAAARARVDQAGELLAARDRLRAAGAEPWPDGVRVLLLQGEVTLARRWVEAQGVEPDREPDLWRAGEYMALAWVQVAEADAEAALSLMEAVRRVAAANSCRGVEAEALLVEALAHQRSGDTQAARECVQSALQLCAPEGFIRLFADGGKPVITILGQINADLQRGRLEGTPYRGYLQRLLARLIGRTPDLLGGGTMAPPAASPAAGAGTAVLQGATALVEPLTERERQILQLIAVGRSNQEVAQELFMGISTVKWHLVNIFGKLQVRSRTQAVAQARDLGLM